MTTERMSASHTGFSDWFWQRATALVLIVLGAWTWVELVAVAKGWVDFNAWQEWNACIWVMAVRSFFVLVLLVHAWIGVKVIAEDYMRAFWIRMSFLASFLVVLSLGFIWIIMNIWGLS